MRNYFWPLVAYEYRKLFRRKIVWITLVVMTAVCIFAAYSRLLGNNYVNGQIYESHREGLEKDITFAKALSGKALDDTLLKEMQAGYAKVPDIPLAGASEEFENYARPYKEIWQFAYYIVGNPACTSVTEKELYQARENELDKEWRDQKIRDEEKEFLRAADNQTEKPFVYTYCEGWEVLNRLMNTLCVLQLLFIAVCIPPVFAEEHSQRTDQLIQCTCFGKKPLYLAKLLVGITFSMVSSLLLGMAIMILLFGIYGMEGAEAVLQLLNYKYVWPLTMGETVWILFGLLLAAALLRTVLAMLMAEYFRSSTIPLALMAGFLIFSMLFHIPDEYRLLSQIWNTFPVNLVSVWGAFESRLYPFLGRFLTPWQAAPWIYLLIGVGAAVLCLRRYEDFQAGGR